MLLRPDAPLGPLRLAGRYRGAPRLRSSARRDAPSPAPGCSTGSRPARPAETPGPPRFLEDPPPCMPRSRTPARRWTPGRCGVPVLPSVVSRTSALATQCFEALSRGLHGPCVRFAAWIAPRPRNTRCRLVASLGRAGLVTRRVPPKGFRAMCYIPLPPSPGFAWRKLTNIVLRARSDRSILRDFGLADFDADLSFAGVPESCHIAATAVRVGHPFTSVTGGYTCTDAAGAVFDVGTVVLRSKCK